jgi:hypothetical protein
MDLHFTGTLAEFQALFSAAGSADALAARLTTFTNQLERIQMDLNQATQLLNTANSKLDTANANAQAGIEALVKIRGETAGLVDAVANLTAIVQAGNVTSAVGQGRGARDGDRRHRDRHYRDRRAGPRCRRARRMKRRGQRK